MSTTVRKVSDHPIKDAYGLEIQEGDVYWVFGNKVVSDLNLKTYLIEEHNMECFRAME
ncbi:hypothetical protein MHI57_07200 [Cytobacillus sp. FSL K6-0129]|uniref:YqaI family protein n=1 Tax=Cytobacillus sp. FSL K6-0129 TaxID=2921421 RepID=UPI0030FBCA54